MLFIILRCVIFSNENGNPVVGWICVCKSQINQSDDKEIQVHVLFMSTTNEHQDSRIWMVWKYKYVHIKDNLDPISQAKDKNNSLNPVIKSTLYFYFKRMENSQLHYKCNSENSHHCYFSNDCFDWRIISYHKNFLLKYSDICLLIDFW